MSAPLLNTTTVSDRVKFLGHGTLAKLSTSHSVVEATEKVFLLNQLDKGPCLLLAINRNLEDQLSCKLADMQAVIVEK